MTCNAFFHFFHTLQGHCILADSTARMRQRQCEYVSSNMLRNTRAWHILVPRCCKDVASDKLKTVVHPMDKKRVVGVLKACARNRKSKLSTLPLVDMWASCNGFVFGGVVHPVFWKTVSMLKDWVVDSVWFGMPLETEFRARAETWTINTTTHCCLVLTMALGSGTSLRRSSTWAWKRRVSVRFFCMGSKQNRSPFTLLAPSQKCRSQQVNSSRSSVDSAESDVVWLTPKAPKRVVWVKIRNDPFAHTNGVYIDDRIISWTNMLNRELKPDLFRWHLLEMQSVVFVYAGMRRPLIF